jgi:hypothetical protein
MRPVGGRIADVVRHERHPCRLDVRDRATDGADKRSRGSGDRPRLSRYVGLADREVD